MASRRIWITAASLAAIALTPANASARAAPDRQARKGWDGVVKGGSKISTPIEIRFDQPSHYDDFAAGRLPIMFVLHNTVSDHTIRIDARQAAQGFQPSRDRNAVTFDVVIDNLAAPVWDEQGCVDVRTGAVSGPGNRGAVVTLDYAPCNGPPARIAGGPIGGIVVKGAINGAVGRTAGNPIGGIIVKGGKNPPGNMRIIPGNSETGEDAERRLRTTPQGDAGNAIVLVASHGSPSHKTGGF